jgi:hypothetical protein
MAKTINKRTKNNNMRSRCTRKRGGKSTVKKGGDINDDDDDDEGRPSPFIILGGIVIGLVTLAVLSN